MASSCPPLLLYTTPSFPLPLPAPIFKPSPSLSLHPKCPLFQLHTSKSKTPNSNPSLKLFAHLNTPPLPLIPPSDHWGTFSVLFATAAFGIWSDTTKIGSTVSGAVVSTLGGLVASNIGIISSEASAYSVVMEYLLPVTIPLLLFKADLRRVMQATGNMLFAFLIGSVATIIGTVVAYMLVPMRSLGQDSWKIAAALMSSYIGGSNLEELVPFI